MKPEQKMAMVFSVFGVAMGLFSNYVGVLALAFVVPIAGYVGLTFAMSKMEREKKVKWVVVNSAMVFVLVWIIAWIFLFNVR